MKREKTPDLNDCLENVHYFPDEKPFQEPFTEVNSKDVHPYHLIENESMTDNYGECKKLQRPLNRVHFAEDSMNDKQII